MESLYIILLVVIVLIGMMSMSRRKSFVKEYRPSRGGPQPRPERIRGGAAFRTAPPEGLGVRPGHPAEAAARRLEAALDEGFASRVLERVAQAHPSLGDGERAWALFELKRFFLLAAVLREVNMFASRVDEVWHEMLMFTREYEDFCKRFAGATIHHAPHGAVAAAAAPAARPWFDWVYGELFVIYPESEALWGPFFRRPLPEALIAELERSPREELAAVRFNAKAVGSFPDLRDTADALIERAKWQIEEGRVRLGALGVRTGSRTPGADPSDAMLASGALMLASLTGQDPDDFERQMEPYREEGKSRQDGSGSGSCSSGTYGTGYGDDRDPDGGDRGGGPDTGAAHDGGSAGSGSSGGDSGGGSSCGSSCGGGCGGGT